MPSVGQRPCSNPGCFCQTPDATCSLWCAAPDLATSTRCLCRHEGCARPLARVDASSPSRDRARPEGRWLIILRQDHPDLYPAARERLVILDRRRTGRRRSHVPVESDSRRADRRQPLREEEQDLWRRGGYRVVYQAGSAPIEEAQDDVASWPSL